MAISKDILFGFLGMCLFYEWHMLACDWIVLIEQHLRAVFALGRDVTIASAGAGNELDGLLHSIKLCIKNAKATELQVHLDCETLRCRT
jgi:hypothetical protein